MICTLCKIPIKNYDDEFNHLRIDELHSAYICSDCQDKFIKWQQYVYTKLFPTTAAKKRLNHTFKKSQG